MSTTTKKFPTTVHFFNFSNGSEAFSVGLEFAHLDVIARHAKKRLASRGVEATYDENADLKPATCGTIWAGMRAVARFRVIDRQERNQDS